MIYNTEAIFYVIILFVIFLFSFFILRKFKYINIFLPKKGSFWLISYIQYWLLFLIAICIFLIPFNIWIYQWTKIKKQATLNIEVLFDVSLSMTVKDFEPDRFNVAKNSLVDFINSLDTNYDIWLITFSGQPFVYVPITDNKKALVWKIQNMKMSDFPPALDFVWTAIWDAIILWTKQLVDYSWKQDKPGVIILFTDWDSNKGTKPLEAVKIANKYNIPIFVWAIWKDKKYIVWKDYYGTEVPTSIDLDLLKKIAEETDWEFLKIEQKEDFLKILSNIYKYVKNYEKIEKIDEYLYLNYYIKLLLILLLVLYIYFMKFNIKK